MTAAPHTTLSDSVIVPQTILSDSIIVPQTMLSDSKALQTMFVPHTMFDPSTR